HVSVALEAERTVRRTEQLECGGSVTGSTLEVVRAPMARQWLGRVALRAAARTRGLLVVRRVAARAGGGRLQRVARRVTLGAPHGSMRLMRERHATRLRCIAALHVHREACNVLDSRYLGRRVARLALR